MVLERLIGKVLRIAIEHAGAQRGLLIVPRGDELRVEAEAMKVGEDVTVYLGESVDGAAALPESVLRSVVRTQQAVLLDDAAVPNAFSADPYIGWHATRSILCLPLLNRSKLIALLYLENNLATKDLLESAGFSAAVFARAASLLKSRRLSQVSCLIADMRMPKMTGLELHQHLVASNRGIPTILMTAYPDERTQAQAIKANVVGYLIKPFAADELIARVRCALRRSVSRI